MLHATYTTYKASYVCVFSSDVFGTLFATVVPIDGKKKLVFNIGNG